MHLKKFLEGTSLIVGATLGAGIFTLPYVFYVAGWATSILYLIALSTCVVFAHYLYWQTLELVGENERLLGLARKFLGKGGFLIGLAAIILGLFFTLVAYILLGGTFVGILFPALNTSYARLLFSIFVSVPFLFSVRRLAIFDSVAYTGVFAIVAMIASQVS